MSPAVASVWVCLRRRPWRLRRRPRRRRLRRRRLRRLLRRASSARAASGTFAAALDEAYREVTENVLVLCMSVPPMMSPMSIMQPSPTKARLFSTSRATRASPAEHLIAGPCGARDFGVGLPRTVMQLERKDEAAVRRVLNARKIRSRLRALVRSPGLLARNDDRARRLAGDVREEITSRGESSLASERARRPRPSRSTPSSRRGSTRTSASGRLNLARLRSPPPARHREWR